MNNSLDELITLLLNKYDDEGGRDDIAMDLSDNDSNEAFSALLQIAQDESDSEVVRDSCIESLSQILYRNKENRLYLNKIGIVQLSKALKIIQKERHDLYDDLALNSLE